MRRITILLFVAFVVYFSSCTNNSTNTNLYVVPSVDSVSKGSYVHLHFRYREFFLHDLIVSNSPVITTSARVSNVAPDSFWSAAVIVTDHTSKTMSLNLSVFNSTIYMDSTYYVLNNGSTLTDFTAGQNRTWSVSLANSWIFITHADANYVTGKVNLNLYYDHDTTLAYGDFKIFH